MGKTRREIPMKKFALIAGVLATTTLLIGCAKKMMLDDPTLYDQYLTTPEEGEPEFKVSYPRKTSSRKAEAIF